jgi:hypothetical protein
MSVGNKLKKHTTFCTDYKAYISVLCDFTLVITVWFNFGYNFTFVYLNLHFIFHSQFLTL